MFVYSVVMLTIVLYYNIIAECVVKKCQDRFTFHLFWDILHSEVVHFHRRWQTMLTDV